MKLLIEVLSNIFLFICLSKPELNEKQSTFYFSPLQLIHITNMFLLLTKFRYTTLNIFKDHNKINFLVFKIILQVYQEGDTRENSPTRLK